MPSCPDSFLPSWLLWVSWWAPAVFSEKKAAPVPSAALSAHLLLVCVRCTSLSCFGSKFSLLSWISADVDYPSLPLRDGNQPIKELSSDQSQCPTQKS